MKVKTMKRLSNVLAGVGFIGLFVSAAACSENNSLKTIVTLGIAGVAITAFGFIGSQLLSNEAEYREYKQRKLDTYGN